MTAVNYLWDPVEQNIVRELDDSGNIIAQYTTEPSLYGDLLSQRWVGGTREQHEAFLVLCLHTAATRLPNLSTVPDDQRSQEAPSAANARLPANPATRHG